MIIGCQKSDFKRSLIINKHSGKSPSLPTRKISQFEIAEIFIAEIWERSHLRSLPIDDTSKISTRKLFKPVDKRRI